MAILDSDCATTLRSGIKNMSGIRYALEVPLKAWPLHVCQECAQGFSEFIDKSKFQDLEIFLGFKEMEAEQVPDYLREKLNDYLNSLVNYMVECLGKIQNQ